MSFWSNPVQSISDAVNGLGNTISNIPSDISTTLTNPSKAFSNLQANPYAVPAEILAATVASGGLGAAAAPELTAADAGAMGSAAADEAAQTAAYNLGTVGGDAADASGAIASPVAGGAAGAAAGTPLGALPAAAATGAGTGALTSALTNSLVGKAVNAGLSALTGGTSGTKSSTTGASSTPTASNLPTASAPSMVNLTPGLTSRESSQINPFGAEFAAPTAANQYVKEGGHIQHYNGGSSVDTNPEMPNQGQRPMLLRGHPGANLASPSAHSMLNIAPHFADGGHVPEFYSEGGMHNRFVKGAGDGTSDDVPAMLANGEFVIPADVVSSLGNGSNDSGAKVLDHFLETIRAHKTAHDPKELPPDSKGALGYLADAHKKVKA